MLVPYVQNKPIDYDNIKKILSDSEKIGQFTNNGPVKQQLEAYLHGLLNLPPEKVVICVSSGTSALHLLMMYYETLNTNCSWQSCSFNFPSCVTNNQDFVMLFDYNEEQKARELATTGYIITNLFGTNCQVKEWSKFCKENDRILILDNCSSPLSRISESNICQYGCASIGSLHHTKFLGFGEGGFIVIDSDKYDKINSLANFGFNNSRKYSKYSSNFKISDISAAFILSHIQHYDLKQHNKIQNRLIDELSDMETIKIFNYNKEEYKTNNRTVFGNLPILFDKNIDNKDFMDLGIQCHKYYYPLVENHKNSWDIYNRIINFPLHAGLSDYQIDFLIKQIKIKANE